jgi:uncharacterized protein YcbX
MGIAPPVRKGAGGGIFTASGARLLDAGGRIGEKRAMNSGPLARVAALYRYPVKGLSGEPLQSVELARGATFPLDRAYALENGPSGFDPAAPSWQPKIKFLCLMRNARLAALSTHYDDATGIFTVTRNGEPLIAARPAEDDGRAALEAFFQDFMGREARGRVRLLSAAGHSFSDLSRKVVSIINLDTLDDLARTWKREIHPLRFRANLYVRGLAPWSELDLVGSELVLGSVRLKIVKTTERCAATEVNPETAERDIELPERLWRLRDSADCGIYAEVVAAGQISVGDAIAPAR